MLAGQSTPQQLDHDRDLGGRGGGNTAAAAGSETMTAGLAHIAAMRS